MTELHRIHGPPGTGKTTMVAAWARRACEKFGGDRVVLASLTRTAAHEIRSRGLPIPEDHAGTLHALCYRALGRPPMFMPMLPDWNERHPRLAVAGGVDERDVVGEPVSKPKRGDELLQLSTTLRARMVPARAWPRPAAEFEALWTAWKHELGVYDFQDLIEETFYGQLPPPGRPAVIFYDEAQDGSAIELKLIRRWAEHAEYAVIAGDGDQLLYAWRGADIDAFLEPLPKGPGAEHPLTQSYRVPDAIRTKALDWIGRCSKRFAVDYRARLTPDGRPVPGHCGSTRIGLSSDGIADLVQYELGQVEGSVMVLASCGYLLSPAIAALRSAGIPFHNPFRSRAGGWNPMRGAVARLAAFLAPLTFPWEQPRLWTVLELWSWAEHASRGVVRHGMKGALQDAARVAKKATRATQGEPLSLEACRAYLTPNAFEEARAALVTSNQGGDLAPALEWLRPRLNPREADRWAYAFRIARELGAAALTAEPRVIVGTIHSVKGGEAASVLLSPDLSPAAAREWASGGEARDGVRRAFYVGMTRASERLTTLGSVVGFPGALKL